MKQDKAGMKKSRNERKQEHTKTPGGFLENIPEFVQNE